MAIKSRICSKIFYQTSSRRVAIVPMRLWPMAILHQHTGGMVSRGDICEVSMQLLRFLLIGSVAGWVIGKITRGRGFGMLGNVLIGGIGSIIGGYLYGLLGVPVHNALGGVVMATVGSIALFLALRMLRPSRRRKKWSDE